GALGADTKPMPIPISQAPVWLGDILINRTYILGGAVAGGMGALLAVFFRTRAGIALRAVADDDLAAWAVGIPVERTVALSWAVSGAVAAVTGVLWGAVLGVGWSLSLLLIMALSVAVLGGRVSLSGVVLAGLIVGVFESVIS